MSSTPTEVLARAGFSPDAIALLQALADTDPDGWRARCPDHPTVADVVHALPCAGLDAAALRAALAPRSALVERGLIQLGGGDYTSHDQREVRIDERVTAFLHGDTVLDRRLARIATLHVFAGPCDAAARQRIARALASPGPIVVEGPARIGKLAAALGAIIPSRPALVCDVPALLANDDAATRLALVRREAMLSAARLVLRVPDWEPTWPASLRRALVELVEDGAVLAIRDATAIARELHGVRRIAVPMPATADQVALWRTMLGELPGIDLVAARYPLPPGDIVIAAAEVCADADLDGRTPTVDDALAAARVRLGHRLGDVAELVATKLTWADVVLPDDVAARVRELIEAVRLRDRVMVEWGFEAKLPYGRSISALLSGPPGTGKTMVCTILGKELGLEVFRVDLSKIVSKYIGETEKNLARVFDEATRCRAILLFDEADSLFAKRTEVRSSNDKFANLEVNFLLQRLEAHDGVVLLTTNAGTAIDRAFLRRIGYRVEFPEPDEHERTRLWQSMIPASAPLATDVDFAALGRRFPMTGGHIKNAVVRAAYRAMAEGRTAIGHEVLVASALAEWTELGNLTPPPDGLARGSITRISLARIPAPAPAAPSGGVTAATEAAVLDVLAAPPSPHRTISGEYAHREQALREVFAKLAPAESRALHARLAHSVAGDPLREPFGRLSLDRRERLLAYLADARRREAVGQRVAS